MQAGGTRLATPPLIGDRQPAKLLRCRIKGGLQGPATGRCLQSSQQTVELLAQRLQVWLPRPTEGLELRHRQQNRLGGVVLRDHDRSATNYGFEQRAKACLGLSRSDRQRRDLAV